MIRTIPLPVAIALLSGCSMLVDQSGPTLDAAWIRSRSLGGVTLDMRPATLVAVLTAMGYAARFRRSTDGFEDDIVTARGVPDRRSGSEMCASPGQPVELALRIRSGRIVQISCLSDGSRRMDRFTNSFSDRVNDSGRTQVSVIAVDHALTSFRALNAANMCPFLRSDPFKTPDDVEFCKGFVRSAGPYIYSYSMHASRFPSGTMTSVVLQES